MLTNQAQLNLFVGRIFPGQQKQIQLCKDFARSQAVKAGHQRWHLLFNMGKY